MNNPQDLLEMVSQLVENTAQIKLSPGKFDPLKNFRPVECISMFVLESLQSGKDN